MGWFDESGISNPRLYDVIEPRLLAGFQADDKQGLERASWYAKALANSGNSSYRSTLDQVANSAGNKKVAKYAKKYAGYL